MKKFILLTFSIFLHSTITIGMDKNIVKEYEQGSFTDRASLDHRIYRQLLTDSFLSKFKNKFYITTTLQYGGLLGGVGAFCYSWVTYISHGLPTYMNRILNRKLRLGVIMSGISFGLHQLGYRNKKELFKHINKT